MMVVMGNGSSFLGRYLGFLYIPVANTIGTNTTWNFFSPDPAHVMYYQVTLFFEDEYGNSVKEPQQIFFPEQKDGSDFRMHIRRQNYMTRFMAIEPSRVQNYFIPWICKNHPGASRVYTSMILNIIPPLDKVIALKETPYEELLQTQEINPMTFNCLRGT